MDCRRRDVFLQIEPVHDYSPFAPLLCARRYGRDCQFNEGHELGRIPAEEILAARIEALVYREYLDADYTQPNTAPLVPSDSTEPPWNRRVPGAVIWARPGERLYIHVRNADPHDCHSLHVHGLHYGIDSDGSWPRGIATKDGRRSDEIRPGESWTYVFDIDERTIGAWPFHDHVRHVEDSVNRGLFGAIIVRDPHAPRVDHEVPMFVHAMSGSTGHCRFESTTLSTTQAFDFTFPDAGEVCDYLCRIHGASMAGRVQVIAGAPMPDQHIRIEDNRFVPADVTVTAGTKVVWTNFGANQHIVFAGGGGLQTFCFNGRAFVGNTPIIAGNSGETIRWFLFNLDVGSVWHNFHPHAARWQLPVPFGGASDVHALSPVESYVLETEIPCALRLPCDLEDLQRCPPRDACRVTVCGDFLFHCHIESHMMTGLVGLVRARQSVWITEQALEQTELVLPLNCCIDECAPVDLKRCGPRRPHVPPPSGGGGHHVAAGGGPEAAGMPSHPVIQVGHPGHVATPVAPEYTILFERHEHEPGDRPEDHKHPKRKATLIPLTVPAQVAFDPLEAAAKGWWELLPCEAPVLAAHAVLMHTGKVLFFAGSGNDDLYTTGLRSAVYDYENGTFSTPTTPVDVFCAGQTVLPDGRVLVAGGTERYDPFVGLKTTLLFDPVVEQWTFVQAMKWGRWYPTLLTLGDGRALAASGGGNSENETYAPATGWSVTGPQFGWPLYPHLHLLADGRVFHSGMRLGGSGVQPGFLNPATGAHTALPGAAIPASFDFGKRDQGATVLLPPAQTQRVMLMGGGDPSISTVHVIDTDAATPQFVAAPSMLRPRIHVNAVILPDRTVVATGGSAVAENFATASLEAEIFDPATNTWMTGAAARVPRMYHSTALLMPDGRVLTAGSNPRRRDDELRLEVYHPPYLFRGPRPCIEQAPAQIRLGETFTLHSPNAPDIKWISLVRPMATTHSYDSEQRLVDVPFRKRGVCHLQARMPANPNLVPPGYYMLFIVNRRGVPSVAKWVRALPAAVRGKGLEAGDILVGTAGKVVRIDPGTMAMDTITEGGALGNAKGIAFDSHGHIVVVTDGGEVVHVVPDTGEQHTVHSSGKVYQDIEVRPDGDYVVVNLPSATPSGLFRIDHNTGADTQLNTGTNFGDGPTGVVIGQDGHYYVAELGARAVIRVDNASGAETIVSSGGHFVSPSGIAVSSDGHLLVVDHGSDKVIHVDPATGHQDVVSSGNHLQASIGIAVDGQGKILVADMAADKLIRIDPASGVQSVVAQGGLLAGIRSVAVVGS
jgi:FtsP/CotA-like multicopper oxidase with cupredoxin domain/sugar lactone lactonase YvrE